MTMRFSRLLGVVLLGTLGSIMAAVSAVAIPLCGDGICDSTAFPAETSLTCPDDCGGTGGGTGGCTLDTCGSCQRPAAGTDLDGDGVPDMLEHDLAHKFFPAIRLQGFADDLDEAYLYRGRATPYTVDPFVPSSASTVCMEAYECLEIRYGIAYFKDTGDTIFGITGHPGDSEFFAALVRRTASWSSARGSTTYWQMIRDFTAAHWGSGSGESSRYGAYGHCSTCLTYSYDPIGCHAQGGCGYVAGQCFGDVDGWGDPCSWSSWSETQCFNAGGTCRWLPPQCYPTDGQIVCDATQPLSSFRTYYASEGKHGLYHSDAECDSGGFWGVDDCPHNQYNLRSHKGTKLQNVGQSWSHLSFDTTIQAPNNCDLHQVWGGAEFGESTPWMSHLTYGFQWRLPPD